MYNGDVPPILMLHAMHTIVVSKLLVGLYIHAPCMDTSLARLVLRLLQTHRCTLSALPTGWISPLLSVHALVACMLRHCSCSNALIADVTHAHSVTLHMWGSTHKGAVFFVNVGVCSQAQTAAL